jgi:hypothetical protein
MTETAIIGQGPNESGWRNWLARHGGDVRCAEAAARRLACTGRVGELLAELVDTHPLAFYTRHWRFNLNARWNGKRNGVDIFDESEAAVSASIIITQHPEIRRVVCLGRNVGRIFGFEPWAPFLSVRNVGSERSYLLFPHPSGRNRWFNDEVNRAMAAVALKRFLTYEDKASHRHAE